MGNYDSLEYLTMTEFLAVRGFKVRGAITRPLGREEPEKSRMDASLAQD